MNNVLEWVKANVFIVVFATLMVAAAIALPMFSGSMNDDVRKVMTERAANFGKLSQLEKGEVLPGHMGVVNNKTLQRYEEVARVMATDATSVQQEALTHNKKDHNAVLVGLFPEPPLDKMDVLPKQFHNALMDAYGTVLAEVRAGMPPDLENLRQTLEFERRQFINQDLKKDESEALDPDEQRQLTEKLTNVRMSMYAEAAEGIGMYLSTDQLGLPVWNQAYQPSVAELFNWQWQFWVIEDVLQALAQADKKSQSVLDDPVKHVLGLSVGGLPAIATQSTVGGRPGAGGFGGAAMSGEGGLTESGSSSSGGTPADPKARVQRNYSISLTGRTTNPLYDVIYVDLSVIVETSRLPQVLDALSKYNFFTVTSLRLSAVDPFAAVQNGFFYGALPVSQVDLVLESVWLRSWTSELMPPATKQVLGVPTTPAAATSASDDST